MAKIAKSVVDADLRATVFHDLFDFETNSLEYTKINDRQYGIIITDLNGVERYIRVGAIVAEERENMTARELMQAEINEYRNAQAQKAQKAEERAKKAAADKAKREAKKEGEGGGSGVIRFFILDV